MPILGITDRGMSFAQIGTINKGAKKDPNANRPGADLPHFRVEFDAAQVDAAKTFRDVYGDQPTEIRIRFPLNEIDRIWDAWMEANTAGRMIARSDGQYFTFLVDNKTGEVVVVNGLDKNGNRVPHRDTVGEYITQKGAREPILMRPSGRLKVIVPELKRIAYLVLTTHSWHDVENISAQLAALHYLTGGNISGIPLVLRRSPRKISTPTSDPARRVRREKSLLSIEADPAWVEKKWDALEAAAYAPLLLPGQSSTIESNYADENEDDENDENDDPKIVDVTSTEVITLTTPPPAEPTPTPDGPRPWAPERVRQMIDDYMIQYKAHKITEGKRKLIAPMLEACFTANQTDRRHAVQHYLTGFSSLKNMGDSMLIALYLWLSPSTDAGGAWLPCKEAVAEANRILETVPDGQDELPF